MTSRTQLFSNNATTTLAAGIAPYDTVITLKDASRFPNPSTNEFFVATLYNGVDIEVIEVTARVGNTLTAVTRARESTNSAYFAEGSKIEIRVTAEYLQSIEDLKDRVDSVVAGTPSIEGVSRLVFSDVPGVPVGRSLTWNTDDLTMDITPPNSGVTLQVGQETFYRVKNQSGQLITNGLVVMAAGSVGNSGRILAVPANASGLYEGKYFLGVVTEDIVNGADGFVTHFGKVRGVPTNGASVGESWADGDVLFAHPTIPGKLTKVRPAVPYEIVTIAIVISAHATNGVLFVRPTIDSHNASVAKYQPASGNPISVQDALLSLDSSVSSIGNNVSTSLAQVATSLIRTQTIMADFHAFQ